MSKSYDANIYWLLVDCGGPNSPILQGHLRFDSLYNMDATYETGNVPQSLHAAAGVRQYILQ